MHGETLKINVAFWISVCRTVKMTCLCWCQQARPFAHRKDVLQMLWRSSQNNWKIWSQLWRC